MTLRDLLPSVRSLGTRLATHRPTRSFGAVETTLAARAEVSVAPLRPPVEIPICEQGPKDTRAAHLRSRGQFLARQDDWEQLAEEIRASDNARALTPCLRSEAGLLAQGAQSDITNAVSEAVARGARNEVDAAIEALEHVLDDRPDCPISAYIVAMTHVEAAQAWRGSEQVSMLESIRFDAYTAHMAAAIQLNDQFDPFEHDTPLWALVRCAVLEADPNPELRVADDYEDLIDLDHANPHHLLQFGDALRPERFGSWELLNTQARRTATHTADMWGVGGYTWVMFGALCADTGAYRHVDFELFVEGLHDILAHNSSQIMANWMAALVGHTLGGQTNTSGARRRLADCLGWIAQDHLREVHPLVWADVPARRDALPDTDKDPLRSGRTRALAALAEFYAPALDAGRRLVFGPSGMRMVKGD